MDEVTERCAGISPREMEKLMKEFGWHAPVVFVDSTVAAERTSDGIHPPRTDVVIVEC